MSPLYAKNRPSLHILILVGVPARKSIRSGWTGLRHDSLPGQMGYCGASADAVGVDAAGADAAGADAAGTDATGADATEAAG
mmetsp:Transcript_41525/g.72975  ORF Transcript_41525/g.72975 Transcript_41525/m.72975 type:complete len:82 (+) Transcript_41525:566-811(+)